MPRYPALPSAQRHCHGAQPAREYALAPATFAAQGPRHSAVIAMLLPVCATFSDLLDQLRASLSGDGRTPAACSKAALSQCSAFLFVTHSPNISHRVRHKLL